MRFKDIVDNLHITNFKISKNMLCKILICLGVLVLIGALISNITALAFAKKTLNTQLESANAAINQLNAQIVDLEASVDNLRNENSQLNDDLNALKQENIELKDENATLKEALENAKKDWDNLLPSELNKRDFKSYMPYTAIKDKSSKQWKMQLEAVTNADGIRYYKGLPMIAIGTGWGIDLGTKVKVVCANGNIFEAIVGDWKADIHTDKTNTTTLENGCRCEFIVDLTVLDPVVRKSGTITTMNKYIGYVVYVVKSE